MDISNHFPIWNKLTPSQQNSILAASRLHSAQKGTIIHNGSLDCIGVLVIKSGQMRAYSLSDDGREITIYRLFDMDVCLFSASCMMPDVQFDIIVEAEKDCEFWIIPTPVFKSLMDESAAVANFAIQIMASRFSDVMWLMEQIMWKSFDKRLAAFLIEESNIEDSDILKITHEKIGNHLGNPREVVTRMLRYFQSEEMVRLTRGTIEIIDREALEKLSDR
ncbi:MAG: Crp/Fnr family transcriptional regulator [Firmicutes bacterium]|nr:Crp/Fnr family transcriptional regulator [Bacillota bacterium]